MSKMLKAKNPVRASLKRSTKSAALAPKKRATPKKATKQNPIKQKPSAHVPKPAAKLPKRDPRNAKRSGVQKPSKSKPKPKKSATELAISPARITELLRRLDATYPSVKCALLHKSAWELLVATILSAQCTDERVNKVTPNLFAKYPTVKHFAALNPEELESDIRSTGFFRNKSKSVVGAAKKLIEDFNGEVPADMDQLLSLPGVARKTANVVLGSWFGIAEGLVVDTHVYRISRRLELTTSDTPQKIEQDLMQIIPRDKWIDFAHQLIWHGRKLCVARNPKCMDCPLENICHAADKTWSTVDGHS